MAAPAALKATTILTASAEVTLQLVLCA